jgi:hypothetical protein
MPRTLLAASLACLALAGCNSSDQAEGNRAPIKVRGSEQARLHELDAFDLGIALKRAIYDAGYTCDRATDAGYVAEYKNLEMWMAHCLYDKGPPRDWAIFTAPDGSAQIRDCKDIPGSGLPECRISQRPKGSFTEPPGQTTKKK